MSEVKSIDVEENQFAYRYDTQLLIDKRDKDLDEDEIVDYITNNIEGNCLIVLKYCNTVGEIYDIVVEDMIRQSAGLQG